MTRKGPVASPVRFKTSAGVRVSAFDERLNTQDFGP